MQTVKAVKFNNRERPEFFKELHKRVNSYFKEKNISKHANTRMKIKTAFMICLYFIPLFVILSGTVGSIWGNLLLWSITGFGMAGIGLSIMHDANHGSYSSNEKVNKALGYLINFLGGYHTNWKIQHNRLHHTYTNVHGHDEDIDNPIMRFSPTQERKKIYKFQILYAPFLYSLMTLYWYLGKDFKAAVKYQKMDMYRKEGMSYSTAWAGIISGKLLYTLTILVLPLLFAGVAWWVTLIGFLVMHFICGLVLALIFQPAHVIEETDFYTPDENNSVENNWAIHQMRTTSNFAHDSKLFSWFIGGLNYQVEHHLFPNICHVHYRHISKIVKATAQEFNVPYHEHRTFIDALRSHFTLLHELGTGKYDKRLATSAAA